MKANEIYHFLANISGKCSIMLYPTYPPKKIYICLILMSYSFPEEDRDEYVLYLCTNDKYLKFIKEITECDDVYALDAACNDYDIRTQSVFESVSGYSIDDINTAIQKRAAEDACKYFNMFQSPDVIHLYEQMMQNNMLLP